MMTADQQLLERFNADRSEAAFGQIVRSHIDLVYSAALRVAAGDHHLAQDASQMVFADLARKADSLPRDTVLPGWLYRHTCFTTSKLIRTEQRRRNRELSAMELISLHAHPEPSWEQIAPLLDDAMNGLSAADRDAIVLRFFQRQDFRTVGAALGISEDTAQKRVARALDKLRDILGQRGAKLTASTLATIILADAVSAAPATLAASITTASLATTAAGTSLTLYLIKLMTISKIKLGIAGAVLTTAIAIPIAQQNSINQLRQENSQLKNESVDVAKLRAENSELAKLQADADELARLRKDNADLPRLRGEVTALRAATPKSSTPATQPSASPTTSQPGPFISVAQFVDAGVDTPEATIQTFLWAGTSGNVKRFMEIADFDPVRKAIYEKSKVHNPDLKLEDVTFETDSFNMAKANEGLQGFQILSQEFIGADTAAYSVAVVDHTGETENHNIKLIRGTNGWRVDLASLVEVDSETGAADGFNLGVPIK